MALDFPANPVDGQVYGSYVYSATSGVWKAREELASPAVVSPVPPTTANPGDIWVDSSDGIAYVRYDDGTSAQWIEMISSGVPSLASKADKTYVDSQDLLKANLSGGNTFSGTQTFGTPLAIGSGGTGAATLVDAQTNLLLKQSPNFLINGAMDFWQRSTSSTSAGITTADRWYGNANATTTFSRGTSVPTGFQYNYAMTVGTTATPYVEQAIETANAIQMAGQTVTLSAYLSASLTTSVSLQLYYSTSNDIGPAGAWTQIGSSTKTVTSGWSRFSATFSVPSNARSIKASFVGSSMTTGNALLITGAQLELGSVATPFVRNGISIQGELVACRRYYMTGSFGGTYFIGTGNGTGVGAHEYSFVPMRVAPTVTTLSFSNGDNASNGGIGQIGNERLIGYYRNASTSWPYYNFSSTFKLEAEL